MSVAVRARADFLRMYTARAPLALAFERTLECKLFSTQQLQRPVLDLGCGDGIFTSILFQERIETGIDPDPKELEHARKLAAHDELFCCFGAEIPRPDSSYMTIFSNSVLEHIPDLTPVLAEAFRLLAPGGIFYCTVPSDTFEIWTFGNLLLSAFGLRRTAIRYRRWFNQFWRHYHTHPASGWERVISEAGFRLVEICRYDSPRVAVMNDLLVPFALPSILEKKFLGRWVLSSILRKILLFPLRPLFAAWLRPVRHSSGCLFFLKAMKPLVVSQ